MKSVPTKAELAIHQLPLSKTRSWLQGLWEVGGAMLVGMALTASKSLPEIGDILMPIVIGTTVLFNWPDHC